jgi:hypothetical protein
MPYIIYAIYYICHILYIPYITYGVDDRLGRQVGAVQTYLIVYIFGCVLRLSHVTSNRRFGYAFPRSRSSWRRVLLGLLRRRRIAVLRRRSRRLASATHRSADRTTFAGRRLADSLSTRRFANRLSARRLADLQR